MFLWSRPHLLHLHLPDAALTQDLQSPVIYAVKASLQGLTKEPGVDVLLSEDTAALLNDTHGLREMDRVTVRGRSGTLTVCAVAAQESGLPEDSRAPDHA